MLLGAAAPAGEPSVRVLLFETNGAIQIAGREVAPGPDGLRVDGADVGPRWLAPARAADAGPGAGPLLQVRGMRVRGDIEVMRTGRGLAVVNEVPLETYLAGTLGLEMPASWEPEALRAQAIVSRTYALHQRAARRGLAYHLRADTRSQMYGGVAAESAAAAAALEATRGLILRQAGAPILAVFHSAAGGRTASAAEVWGEERAYLQSVPVPDEDESPDTYWRVVIAPTTLGRAAARLGHPIGDVRGVKVLARSPSGRVRRVRLRGSGGEVSVTGRRLREALGEGVLKSTAFDVRLQADGLAFFGTGSGHGVGMSQWGARAMARRGASHREILEVFFPGAQLERFTGVPPVAAAGPGQGETR